MLIICQSGISQTITKIVPCEYVTYFVYSDNNLYTVGGTARTLPGARLVLDASGAFNSARALATDGTYWKSTDYTQSFVWSQGPTTDTTGAAFNDGIALWSWADCTIVTRADSSLWMQGNDSVGIYHNIVPFGGAGTRYIINQPIKLSQSGVKYQKVVIGGNGIYGLTGDGKIYFWARNSQTITPTQIWSGSPRPAIDIATATFDCFIAIIQNATGDPTCGRPYCKGLSYGDWGGNGSTTYATLTDITSVWGLPYSIKKVTETSNSMHIIDSIGDMYGVAKCNSQGELGNGVEFVNRYTYSTFPGYGWTFSSSENPVAAPMIKINAGFKHKEIYGASFFGYFKYATDSTGRIFFWGRNKANLGATGLAQNATDNNNHPNAVDEVTPIEVFPLTVSTKTTRFVAPAITITQGNQSISISTATLTAGGNSMLQINQNSPFDTIRTTQASYLWTGTGGTINSPTTRSTTVSGLSNGTYIYTVLMTDNYGGTDTAKATVTVTLSGPTTYYVSATGSDANNGTSSATPWQTLSKVNSISFNGGDSVLFKRGDVFSGRLNCTRSGSAGSEIVYSAYGIGVRPIITGFITLSTWVNNGGGIYASAAPGIKAYAHNLNMDGRPQNIARFPNTGYITFTPGSTTSITDPTLTGTPSHVGDSIVVRSSRFTLDHALITNQATTVLTITPVNYSGVGGNGYFYFNSPKWLDTLGEWTVNSTLDSVYVYFGPGTPTGHTVQVSIVDSLVYATGSFLKLRHLRIQGGNMYNLLSPFGSGNIVVDSCVIDDAYTGADLRSVRDTVINSKIEDCLNNGLMGPANNISKYVYVANDTIRRIGLLPGMGNPGTTNYEAVNLPADDACFFNLEIDSIGYHGVYTSYDSFMVKGCHINHYCMTLADGGGVYTWDASAGTYAHRREISGNLIENGFGNTDGTVIDPNARAMGIYGDGAATNVLASGNTVINNTSPGLFSHGTNITFDGNKVYGNGGGAQCLISQSGGGPTVTGVIIKNNIFASPDTSVAAIFFFTPSTNILTMATADSNKYVTTNAITPFKTQGNGGAVITRTLAGWQTFLTQDAHSTYQTGTLVLSYNTARTNINRYLSGKYMDPYGVQYIQLVPISALSSAILFQLSSGLITLTPGVRIIAQ